MREMNLSDIPRRSRLEQTRFITTGQSDKTRSDDEMILLMKSVRNRFIKDLASGKIEILSDREWRIR